MSDRFIDDIAALFPRRWDRHYVASKLRADPLYEALTNALHDSQFPLLDLGCGLGLLSFFLRSRGVDFPIHGLDYDVRKIEAARHAAKSAGAIGLSFSRHDAREGLPGHQGNVTILDILQFFRPDEQETLLQHAASRVAPGGKLIIRSGLRDDSLRFKITIAGDILAKATFWMKAAPVHYPSAEDFHRILIPYGSVHISPLWGATPFNNYLIVLQRPLN